MINILAISNYISQRKLIFPLTRLNIVTGANGSGKSSLYRALRLLAQTAQGGLSASLAREGGLSSMPRAGPETLAWDMKSGRHPVQGTALREPVHLKHGFAGSDFSYAINLGLPSKPPGHRSYRAAAERALPALHFRKHDDGHSPIRAARRMIIMRNMKNPGVSLARLIPELLKEPRRLPSLTITCRPAC